MNNSQNASGLLYLVATPIGNIKDISLRAIEVLQQSDIILCEDTRHSKKLFNLLGIQTKKLISLNSNNEESKTDFVIDLLKQGKQLSLVSDAGTPVISDPGARLVNSIIQFGYQVSSIPGASSLINALVCSGFNINEFIFLGFLSNKSKTLQNQLMKYSKNHESIVFFESCHRIRKTLQVLNEVFPADCQICIAREMTKINESFYRGKLNELTKKLEDEIYLNKGEIVIVLQNLKSKNIETELPEKFEINTEALLSDLLQKMDNQQAIKILQKHLDFNKKLFYNLCIKIKNQNK